MHNTNEEQERLVLVGIENDRDEISEEESLDELSELAKTAGAVVCDRMIQKRDKVHPGHYLGKGKLEELKDLVTLHNADAVCCDDELSSKQMRNMSEVLEVKVIDRTMLILDIFAARASSAEGKAQVELAQLKYNLSHLTGLGKSLSRLGGGIGTRGPGESKLESDRRHLHIKIYELESQLKEIKERRNVQREKREKTKIPVVSLAGYTNSGKSTLMNLLTNAGVLEEDKLFATLDTTTRKVKLTGGTEILLSDTVGFISKLPHNLIKAFHATLEEMAFADILLHVVDASNPIREKQMQVVYDTLKNLDCLEKPIVTVFNKMDKEVETPLPVDKYSDRIVAISAKTSQGKDKLIEEIEKVIASFRKKTTVIIPYIEGQLLSLIHERCEILREEHKETGTYLELYADEEIENRTAKFACGEM